MDGTDGSDPNAALVQGTDGNLYGVTTVGGSSSTCNSGCGTIFKITPAGKLTTLHSFCVQKDCPDGAAPQAGLVQATDGDFYGTTEGSNAGTVFKITASGKVSTLHRFSIKESAEGYDPRAGLVQATDGNFYGTTLEGGAGSTRVGTVFQMTPAGKLTTLYSFCALANCVDGSWPYSGLVQGTYFGGNEVNACGGFTCGTVFQLTPAGKLTTLLRFDWTDGGLSNAGLVQGTDGNFYGTSSEGGSITLCGEGCGTVFAISMGLAPFVKTNPTSGRVGAKVIILGNNLTSTTSVTFNGTTAPLLKVTASAIETSVPAGATTGPVTVTTPGTTLNGNVPFRVLP